MKSMKRKINNKIFILLLLIVSVSFYSCGQANTSKQDFEQFRTQRIELRDSLLILYTVKEWGKKMWWTWAVRSDMYKITTDDVQYFIEGTFYSPDRKKLLVWVGEKMPNAATNQVYSKEDSDVNKLCPSSNDTIYSLSALIGIRDNINEIWKLYPFDQQAAGCFNSKKDVVEILCKYYFVEMKTHKMYRVIQSGKLKGNLESQAYGYNLQDKDFWNKCWLFQKDTVGSYNLYPFQIKRYDYKGEKCSKKCAEEFNLPNIIYPKDILNLYY